MIHEILVKELEKDLLNGKDIFLLDVRNPDEYALFNLGARLIPLSQLPQRMEELPQDKPIVIYCHSGVRSLMAVEFLLEQGFKEVKNLIGGIVAWRQEIGDKL